MYLKLADHGGTGKGHGDKSLAEADIPSVMRGPEPKRQRDQRDSHDL